MAEDRPMCQCPHCGRMHWKLANRSVDQGGELPKGMLQRLSRVFNETADIRISTPDSIINDWLKAKIAQAGQ